MSTIGLSVPPGLTITTEVCKAFNEHGRILPKGVWENCLQKLRIVEKDMGKKLGDPETPLLLSVRSGAAMSMPGMMDTVLNLGLNDVTAAAMEKSFGERFAMVSENVSLPLLRTISLEIHLNAFVSNTPPNLFALLVN